MEDVFEHENAAVQEGNAPDDIIEQAGIADENAIQDDRAVVEDDEIDLGEFSIEEIIPMLDHCDRAIAS